MNWTGEWEKCGPHPHTGKDKKITWTYVYQGKTSPRFSDKAKVYGWLEEQVREERRIRFMIMLQGDINIRSRPHQFLRGPQPGYTHCYYTHCNLPANHPVHGTRITKHADGSFSAENLPPGAIFDAASCSIIWTEQ